MPADCGVKNAEKQEKNPSALYFYFANKKSRICGICFTGSLN